MRNICNGVGEAEAMFVHCTLIPFTAVVMADAEGISLEETNKIRISLGLKPLTDDKAPVADKEKEAEDNFAKAQAREAKTRTDK